MIRDVNQYPDLSSYIDDVGFTGCDARRLRFLVDGGALHEGRQRIARRDLADATVRTDDHSEGDTPHVCVEGDALHRSRCAPVWLVHVGGVGRFARIQI